MAQNPKENIMMRPERRQYSVNNHCVVCGGWLTAPDANNTQYCRNPKHTEELTDKNWYFSTLTGWTHK